MVLPGHGMDTQLQTTRDTIWERGRKLSSSMANMRNRINSIKQWIKPAATYPFSLAPFTVNEVALLDRALARVGKMCAKLPPGFSTSGALRSHDEAGLGLESFMIDYAQICAASLTHALRDEGSLGVVTRALLKLQVHKRGGAPVEHIATECTRYCTLLRQLTLVSVELNGNLTFDGQEYPLTLQGPSQTTLWNLAPLLRSKSVPMGILACLYDTGVRHLGQLVTAQGTHLITPPDLVRLFGSAVTSRHKVALNQLSCSISGQLPKGATSLLQVRSTQPLDLPLRAIPLCNQAHSPKAACPMKSWA